ncbi:MAG TPA: hypothetical protein PLZ16_13170, partial [Gammaproteobacteria bacterium]|nr:hypothetical protein [Gammaproteobacteria bacterium]
MGIWGNASAYDVDGKLDDWLSNAPASATYSSYSSGYNIGNPYLRFESTTDGQQMQANGSNSSWKPMGDVVYTVEDGYSTPGESVPGGHLYE